MSIRVTCADCGAASELADRQAGKKVRCTKCSAVISVPDEEAEPVRRPAADAVRAAGPRREQASPVRPRRAAVRRDEDDEDDAPARKKKREGGVPLGLLIGGGAAVLVMLLAVGGVVGYLLLRGGGSTSSAAGSSQVADGDKGGTDKDRKKDTKQDPKVNPKRDPGGNGGDPKRNDPPARWQVQADPAPAEWTPPDKPDATIPIAAGTKVVFPSTPSPFVSVAAGPPNARTREVWDLRNGQRVGGVAANGMPDPVLSPDGAYLAARNFGSPMGFDVWAVADGRPVKLQGDGQPGGGEFDFAGPGRLLTLRGLGFEQQVQVWDLKTGAAVRQFTAPVAADHRHRALSPGGRYLAALTQGDAQVLLYDLTGGEQAGVLPVAGGHVCQGIAFSQDGKKLAGLFTQGVTARLMTWDMATGKLLGDHKFDKNPQHVTVNATFYPGPVLEALPDGSGWLLYGQLLVDGQSGAVFWTLPTTLQEAGQPRRLFGGVVAQVKGDFTRAALTFETLPADKLAAARQGGKAALDPAATALPPLKAADWSAVKEIKPAPGPWQLAADPAPAPHGKPAASVPLNLRAGDIVDVLFSQADAAQAAVLTASSGPDQLSERRQVRADSFDLVSGKHLGGLELFAADFPRGRNVFLDAALSPDGALLAVKAVKAPRRVDLWSLTAGKHVVGWRVADKDADGGLRWLAFAGPDRLLTLAGDRLTLWEVPACRAVYTLQGVSAAALSPGRKYLVVSLGATLQALETATGAGVGQTTAPGSPCTALAFRPDGRALAGLVVKEGRQHLARWDALTGAAGGDFPVAGAVAGLEWCGADHVLFGATLYDLNRQGPLCVYGPPNAGRHAPGGPDGRHWFVTARNVSEPPAVLTAQTLPDAAAKQLAAQLAGGQAQVLLAPPMAVAVRVEGATPPGDGDAFRRNLAGAYEDRLRNMGFRLAADAPLTLTVRVQPPRDTGEIHRYESIGGVKKERTELRIQEVAVEATLNDARNGVLWTQKVSARTSPPPLFASTEELQRLSAEGLWNNVRGVAASMTPPRSLMRTGAGVEPFPRFVSLTGDR